MKPIVLALVVAVLGFLGVDRCNVLGAREFLHVRANAQLLDKLPAYPDSVEIARESHTYSSQDSGIIYIRPDGWLTRVRYDVPAGTTAQDVREFFEQHADSSWTSRDFHVPGVMAERGPTGIEATPVSLSVFVMCRGDGHVTFELDGIERAGAFWIAADHSRPGQACE